MATRREPALRACRLGQAPVRGVLELIRDERRDWAERLLWDPVELSRALELAASAGLLPGAAVLSGRRVMGYLSWQASAETFRPCSVRLRDDAPAEAAELLVGAALGLPEASGRRLEAQLTAFGWQDALDRAMRARGVGVVPRDWLWAHLEAAPPGRGEGAGGVEVRRWSGDLREGCAAVLAAAHASGVEALINAAFRDPEAAERYLVEVERGPGCGHLLSRACRVAVEEGRVIGFCLATTVSDGVAHVPQVAVHPDRQGRGVGVRLLAEARAAARAEGCRRVTLSVSRANERARAWYRRAGFQELARLSAYHRP